MKIQFIEITEKLISWGDVKYSPTEIILLMDKYRYTVKIDFDDKESAEEVRQAIQARANKMRYKLKTSISGLSLYLTMKN